MPAPTLQNPAARVRPVFDRRGWSPFPFQEDAWRAYLAGESGLLHAPTGLGKTLAAFLGPVAEGMDRLDPDDAQAPATVLWITPLRALAADTLGNLRAPLVDLGLRWEVGARTGDTSSYRRAKLRERLPFCLVTTPESLSLMLTYPDFREKLAGLRCVVADEWHELLGTKRGVQTELCLARLRRWFPELRTWGLSATIGNLHEAARVLSPDAPLTTISGDLEKEIRIDTLLPKEIGRFPWSGHIGTSLLKEVAAEIAKARTTLLFTNTRSQTEIWHRELSEIMDDPGRDLAVHHGSLDLEERRAVEARLREGSVRCVVCTSSLDLGVDFSPVDQVIQLGSPKGVARLLQRAGRSGHQPGAVSRILCVPTQALELVEFAATRDAIGARHLEARIPLRHPLDVLVQHLLTVVIGQPDAPGDLRREVESTHAFQGLADDDWEWALAFITTGGRALAAYPNYRKARLEDGKLTVPDKRHIQLHRMSIGTITSDLAVTVRFARGPTLGTVEEGFVARMRPGTHFIFAGRLLELVRFRNQVATVKPPSRRNRGEVPIWGGAKMPLSNELAAAVAQRLQRPPAETPETERVAPILAIQRSWSELPSRETLLVEHARSREGEHLFVFPLAGRLVHEGLGTLAAHRLTESSGATIQVTMNDYGFGLHSNRPLPLDEDTLRRAFSPEDLLDDLLACLNTAELARRHFREVARVAGLVVQNFPGRRRTTRDLQASSSLLFDVFRNYDPQNLLLQQAEREILEHQLELTRLKTTMRELETRPLRLVETKRLTPLAFPLWAERLSANTTGKDYATRLAAMLEELEQAAGSGRE
ncbi:MAG: ligase-associated DNA damage response DEXH box helicase [Akkermansiaceae bacterium]|nr:ligase-associated DNA damage response DEXH box helicase [Akkermansiaceae bacterium]